MSFLARLHWWRKLRGGRWEADSITGDDWVRVDERANFVRNEIHEMGLRAIMSEEIKALRRQLNEAQNKLARAEMYEKDYDRQNKLLTDQLAIGNKQYAELRAELMERENEVASLKLRLALHTQTGTETTSSELQVIKAKPKPRKKKPRDGIATPRK